MPELALMLCQQPHRILDRGGPEKRHDIDGRHLQIGGTGHLADGDRHGVQLRVVDLGPVQNIGKGASDQFAYPQLTLGRPLSGGGTFCGHKAAFMLFPPAPQRQGFNQTQTGINHGIKPLEGEMSELPGIVVTGVSGRMGQMLVKTIAASDKARLVAAVEREGSPWIGRDLGEAMGGPASGVIVTDDPVEAFAKAQGVIDFTTPAATVTFAGLAAQARAVHVIGTTGLSEDDLAKLEAAARHAVIVRAGNMSLGVNLLTRLTQKIAAALDEDWDIEVVEAHHRHKVDAPSGTALMLGEAAAQGRGRTLQELRTPAREGITGARAQGSIGFSAIRGGDVVGEHDVIFAADGERVVLRHLATDRSIFARGALRAAIWGQGRKPGQYDMMDVLGL